MTTLNFTHTLSDFNRYNIENGATRIDVQYTLDVVETNRIIADAEDQLLIGNLKDRGYVIMSDEDAEGFDADVEGGEILQDLSYGLLGAIKQQNSDLTLKLLEAIIFGATGEQIELRTENKLSFA